MSETALALDEHVALRGRLLRDLSIPVPQLAPETALRDVEQRFRDDPELRAVAVTTSTVPALLTRIRLERMLSGRLGFGRPLLARAALRTVVEHDGFHLTADQTLREAASAILAHDTHDAREDDVLVLFPDGRTAVAPVARIFREVGMMFREIALRDPLTGLANRRMLDEHGGELLSAGLDAVRLGVLYVDLDGFKQVNDALGHQAGDKLLLDFAQRLVRAVRPSDVVGRIGGDEFAVLLNDVEESEAAEVADRIVQIARRPFSAKGQEIYVSASVGIATGRDLIGAGAPTMTTLTALDTLLQRADSAMLHAKRSGKARTSRLSEHEEVGEFERRALIRNRLHHALEAGGLELYYQPKLSLGTGSIDSVEALLRWTDAELGVVSPLEVIAVAEHSGQIAELGDWVLRTACAQARTWLDEGRAWSVAINVSPLQLAAPGLTKRVVDALDAAGIPPHLLQIEVTEGSAVTDVGLAVTQLSELQEAGVKVHLDDFGTGHSSLARLRRLPVSTLKIDQSIVGRIDSDEADAQLLSGVINAAHIMGLNVVAEGVERHSQIDRLRELGCDIAQGFLISHPQTAQQLAASVDALADAGRPALPEE